MAEAQPANVLVPAEPATASSFRSSVFQYYIHDSASSFRLQLIGELSESEVTELDSCWKTAKCTLGDRKVVVDLRALNGIDEAGKKWLTAMQVTGAEHLPESFMDDLSGRPEAQRRLTVPAKINFIGRLLAIVRGQRVCDL